MPLKENNIAYVNCLNGDTGKIELEKRIEVIKLSIDNPAVIMKDAQKFAVCLSNVISGTMADWIFALDNQVLAIKVFASVSGLKDYTLASNEIAYVGGDPHLRNTLWLNIKNLNKTLSCEYLTECSVFNSFNMNEVAKKINALNPAKIDNDISNLQERILDAELRLEVIDTQIDQIGNDIESLKTKTDNTENNLNNLSSHVSTNETNISSLSTKVSTAESDIVNIKNKTAGINRTETTTTITDSLKAGGTLEVVGKATLKDIEVKGNVIGALKDSEGYRYVKVRTGSIANSGRFKDMKFILQDGVATVKGNYDVAANQNVNTLDIYNFMADIIPPVIIKLNKINFYSTKKENEFYVNTTINDDTSFFINFRNTTGETKNIQYSTFNFVIECLIDVSSSNIIWD